MDTLSFYTRKFSKLHTAKIQGRNAPHKPILLLAIIRQFKNLEINQNKIFITPDLVASFKDVWNQLVIESSFTANFSLPFYHLKSEGFWHLKTKFGQEILLTSSYSIKSFAQLKQIVEYAYFDNALFDLLQAEHTRTILEQTLLNSYFQNHHITSKNEVIQTIVRQILNEPSTLYKSKAGCFDEEEIFIRNGVFKKEIPKIYNYTCCISGLRIIADKDVQMIDACHIVPWAISKDDTIGNGFSLCPTLHRAFDRGLVAIDDNYRVLVKYFHEEKSIYSIRQFEGKQILLPNHKMYYPLLQNLRNHRERFGFV